MTGVQTCALPISAKVAAAEEPASPEPTTMISILLLFAGLTRDTDDLYFDHLSPNGPSGILASKLIKFVNYRFKLMKSGVADPYLKNK